MNRLRDSILTRWARWWQRLTIAGQLRAIRPWALLPGPLVLLLTLVAPYRWLFFVAYSHLVLVVLAYLWVREVGPRVQLRRRLRSEWGQVGDELEELWDLRNDARLPLLWLEIDDASTLPGYAGQRVAAASAGEHHRWLTRAICERRGVYTLGPLTARTGDPLGLFRYEWREGTARQIVIYPPLVRLPPLHIPQGQRGGLARADLLQQHVTPSVGGLREYVPGDLPSHIHWPTVAKTQRLMVKEFDQERAGALWIVLDLCAGAYPDHGRWAMGDGHPTTGPAERSHAWQSSVVSKPSLLSELAAPLELAIVLAGSLAAQALAEGRAVGLLADDGRQRLVTPGHGPRQLWRILGELVDAQATGALALGDLLRQGHAAHATEVSGAALVVVTPALDGAWLPALAAWQRGKPGGALALLVAERAALARPLEARLASSGVEAYTFEVGTPLPLLTPPKPRPVLRVTPLGRIVSSP